MTRIAAIVCTHNRADHLPRAIDSLLAQSAPAADYEIVIVDNRSSDATAEIGQAYSRRHRHVRYLFEPVLGLSAARNAGLAGTAAELVGFIDDDAIAAPDWIARMLDRFATLQPTPAGIGGEIDPVWGQPRPSWLSDEMLRPLSAHLGWSDQAHFLTEDEWICEVNSAYRREIILHYGGFPTKLGRRGSNLLSGENAVNELMRRDGHQLFFDPAIRVRHVIHADRLKRDWFRRRYFWQGVTAAFVVAESRRAGLEAGHWRMLDLPQSSAEWVELFDDFSDDGAFQSDCDRLAHIGYLLAMKGLIESP
jgi:glucosyl-dolichyl phosphate glucuronosyltransferase